MVAPEHFVFVYVSVHETENQGFLFLTPGYITLYINTIRFISKPCEKSVLF